MSIELVVEMLDCLPNDLTAAERLVLVALAEKADRRTRRVIFARDEDPVTVLSRRTGLAERGLRDAFRRLAERGLDPRVSLGTDKRGRPVFAHAGRSRDYRIPVVAIPEGDALVPPSAEAPLDPVRAEGGTDMPPSRVDEAGKGGTTVPSGGAVVPPGGAVVPPLSLLPSSSTTSAAPVDDVMVVVDALPKDLQARVDARLLRGVVAARLADGWDVDALADAARRRPWAGAEHGGAVHAWLTNLGAPRPVDPAPQSWWDRMLAEQRQARPRCSNGWPFAVDGDCCEEHWNERQGDDAPAAGPSWDDQIWTADEQPPPGLSGAELREWSLNAHTRRNLAG